MVTNKQRGIVLASGSPRRADLLAQVGLEHVVVVPRVPEERAEGEDPGAYTRRLAESKAQAAAELTTAAQPDWVLAADTIVVCDGEVLEKPESAADAAKMLRHLSGRWHAVLTSFCWLHRFDDRRDIRTVTTEVLFRELTDEIIDRYVATNEPLDKAGAYGIQGVGAALCREIRGSYSCVVGLPVCDVIESLQALGGLSDFPFVDD